MSKGVWIGVDVGKQDFSAALAFDGVAVRDWARLPVHSFPFSEPGFRAFVAWVKACTRSDEILGICIESTGRLGWRWMETLGDTLVQVAMVNPARPKAFAASMGLREKTDRIDACVLALYGASMDPQPTAPASPVLRELRECNRLFSVLSGDRQAYAKRLADGPASASTQASIRIDLTPHGRAKQSFALTPSCVFRPIHTAIASRGNAQPTLAIRAKTGISRSSRQSCAGRDSRLRGNDIFFLVPRVLPGNAYAFRDGNSSVHRHSVYVR